ncbi:zinc finger, CCHC-type containing protein, partial [Tanacetum coccineum]
LDEHFKLSLKDCPFRDCDVKRMSKVPYANAIRSLMYLMCTRPDIAYALSVVSRYLANPSKNHWEAVKWILKYLRGTTNVGLVYGTDRGNHVDVTGFVDSDYSKDPDKGRSITGYAFLVRGCVVSWKATLQHVAALSTIEEEYMPLTEAVKEAIWLRGLLEELGVELNTVAVNCENQGAIHLSRNHVFHKRTKHINVRYHFIREVLEAKTVKFLKVGTEHNVADALTKVVLGLKLQHCLELLNVEVKYMVEDASSKKFLVVMEQYNKLLGILGRFTQHIINMDGAIQVTCIIDKLPPSWKNFKHTLKHNKEELTLVELGSHLRIEESLRAAESRVLGAVVRLSDPKLKTLGERGIECVFVGYTKHSKAFRFYVIELNDSVAINSIIESRDTIFDENRFSSVLRPSQKSLVKGTVDSGGSMVPEKVTEEVVRQPEPETRKSKRHRTPKYFGPEFQLYLIEGTRAEDVAFWKEVINDDMDSIMGNNTWVLADLPSGCKPLGCKWIFKRKLKVDGTVEKFNARLVIQGFKQKSGIDYFDTYALVARISTIRLLIAIALSHSLIIHQMDVKMTFLNGELDEEVYMNQPQGFIMTGNENKVCKLIKSLYELKQAPKQWNQKFDEVVLSNGYLLNQADKCLDLTKEFLSSRFSMKDMGEADVILVSTPIDTSEKLMPNKGQAVSQLKYSRVIGCLIDVRRL